MLNAALVEAFYRVFHALSYIEVPRDAGDFSLMDRRVIEAVNPLDERDRFLRGLRAWVGFKQIGVPYERPERMFGVTTNNLRKNIAWARKGIFSFSFVPLEIIFYLALGVSALTGLMLVLYAIVYLFAGAPTGFMTLLTIVLLMGSLQFLCLAVIGDYVGRVLEEVKSRPHYPRRVGAERPAHPRRRAPPTVPPPALRRADVIERNVSQFDADVRANAGYLYTTNAKKSSVLANQRLTDVTRAMVDLRGRRVIDVGCGDGTLLRGALHRAAGRR